jgi:hypothetical protein
MAREKCGLLAGLRTVPCQLTAFRISDVHCRVITEIPPDALDNVVHGAAAANYAYHA